LFLFLGQVAPDGIQILNPGLYQYTIDFLQREYLELAMPAAYIPAA